MTALIAGMLLFFATHSTRIVADGWRNRQVARLGEKKWKGMYAAVSLVGLGLMIWGYGPTRIAPDLWPTPIWTRHLAALLTLPAFILIVAAYMPGNHFKSVLGHPMLAGVVLWAFAHLLTNTRPGDLLLFGVFLVWAVIAFVASRLRDRRTGTRYPQGTLARDVGVVAIGTAAWAAFAFVGHAWLIGVRPFG
jgi:uncharacterized membrane protein